MAFSELSPTPRPLSRLTKAALYSLKRAYGAAVDVYKLDSTSTNPKTGIKAIVKSVVHIRRAAVMPAGLARKAVRGISLISANKQLVEGGTYDTFTRDFLIDRRDCPGLSELTADDWIVFDSKKFQIQSVEDYEFDAAWIVTARCLKGEVPERIVALHITSLLTVGDTADGS